MKKYLKTVLLAILVIFGVSFLAAPISTYAVDGVTIDDIDACSELTGVAREAAGCDNSKDALPEIVLNILNAIIGIAGLIAVVFIIIGGLQYMTSTGDPGKIKKAKDTILYASIGLIVCALAFAIINWVINLL